MLAWLASVREEELGLPGVVKLELLNYAPDKDVVRRTRKAISPFVVYWPTPADCERAVEVFAVAKLSHGMDPFDALIGETAVGMGVRLCTFNVKHFSAMPGLETVQPYEK